MGVRIVLVVGSLAGASLGIWRAPALWPPEGQPTLGRPWRLGARSLSVLVEQAWQQRCAKRIAGVQGDPSARRGPLIELPVRAEMLARAASEPVLFWRKPQLSMGRSLRAKRLLDNMNQAPSPGNAFIHSIGDLVRDPSLTREVLLREGYFVVDSPSLAAAVARTMRLEHLFSVPELVIERGDRVLRAVRVKGRYEDPDRSGLDRRAQLRLFDRVYPRGDSVGPPLHRSVRKLKAQLGFERLHVRAATERAWVVDLSYGDHTTRAVLESNGAGLDLECELVARQQRAAVAQARRVAERRADVVRTLTETILAQVEEALPFDEPKTEEGQQDGKLRAAWKQAYRQGRTQYEFNGDRYWVFDSAGRPYVPQVCIDFVVDTLERASGTWWRGRGEPRQKRVGSLDFDRFEVENRRSVEAFLRFAESRPAWFDVQRWSSEERVPFAQRSRFFAFLYDRRETFIPGDIVVIYGLRDDGLMHYHSFFIVDADPVTGMPTVVASNAGRPRMRSWETEMLSAPRRGIHARVRPRLGWYELSFLGPTRAIAAQEASPAASPPI